MFWKRKSRPASPVRADFAVPDGRRVYAIGDIHGRDDLFAQLIAAIRADHQARGPAEATIILLGDLVDRGPQSAEVIDRAIALRDEFPDTRLLIGYQEECFLASLTGDVRRLRYFMRIGGEATVRSYWNDDKSLADASFEDVAERLPDLVPAAHVDFLGHGEDMVAIGDYLFVHAGIRPGVPLEIQSLADRRWSRDEFPGMRLLIGNHEECFLAALTGDVRRVRYFMRIGGEATVRSYWRDDASFEKASFEEVAERLPGLVPAAHVDFLGQGEDMVAIGDYLFVHAGIRPGVPLEKQSLADLRWIRDEFLDNLGDHGKMVVHGHSITAEPDEQANRIGIDLGAFRSGILGAVGLEGSQRWFLYARDGAIGQAA